MPTPAVFDAMIERAHAEMPVIPAFEGVEDTAAWLAAMRNDMQDAAVSIQPVIERALSDLKETRQCLLARMSGSGATCFAIYPTMKAAHFAAYEFGAMHTDWWIRPCILS
jgi:4-diphosphocytidyl-2-C-methyl-D-erythritol kinase